jgi:hypothetical protein
MTVALFMIRLLQYRMSIVLDPKPRRVLKTAPASDLADAQAATLGWEAYEQRMARDLKSSVTAYVKGDHGTPADAFFDSLRAEDKA